MIAVGFTRAVSIQGNAVVSLVDYLLESCSSVGQGLQLGGAYHHKSR